MMDWQHGYRCHGLWNGPLRLAFVGLPPRGFPVIYRWSIDVDDRRGGTCATLRRAKRAAEQALAKPAKRA